MTVLAPDPGGCHAGHFSCGRHGTGGYPATTSSSPTCQSCSLGTPKRFRIRSARLWLRQQVRAKPAGNPECRCVCKQDVSDNTRAFGAAGHDSLAGELSLRGSCQCTPDRTFHSQNGARRTPAWHPGSFCLPCHGPSGPGTGSIVANLSIDIDPPTVQSHKPAGFLHHSGAAIDLVACGKPDHTLLVVFLSRLGLLDPQAKPFDRCIEPELLRQVSGCQLARR